MTGTPENSLEVPLYKICCLIPYQVNEQDIVYLSSLSEINRFLQVHGIGDKFGVDSGKSSTATCTEDLPIRPETRKILITNNFRGKHKETSDHQIQYNKKNVNKVTCCRNEIVPWHKCCKNESLVHFCKKSNSSLYDNTNKCSPPQNLEKETEKAIQQIPVLGGNGHIKDSSSLKKVSQKGKSDSIKKKKTQSFTNRSFIRILKKWNKDSRASITKPKNNIITEKIIDTCDKSIETRIALLTESVICETNTESCLTAGVAETNGDKSILEDKKAVETQVTPANSSSKSPIVNSVTEEGDYNAQLKEDNKELVNSRESSDNLSDQSSILECSKETPINQNTDMTFYENPSKFVENMSECVMRLFIGEECEDSWLKTYEGKQIPKKYLGVDKDLSELYILKKMAKHENCLISHLTPRQKRLLARSIVNTLEEFNIKGSRWGGLSRETLKNVCRLFKIQQGLVP